MKKGTQFRGNSIKFAEKKTSPTKVLGEHNPRAQSKPLNGSFQNPEKRPPPIAAPDKHSTRTQSKHLTESLQFASSKQYPISDDSETTHKLTNENAIYCSFQNSTNYSTSITPSTSNNILKVKQLVAEILDEGVKARQELQMLKEKVDYTISSKDSQEVTRKEIIEFDISSIKSSPKKKGGDIKERICDLKAQLHIMNQRIHLGERQIMERTNENTELKFIIYKLYQQVETIKKQKLDETVKKSTCLSCCVF